MNKKYIFVSLAIALLAFSIAYAEFALARPQPATCPIQSDTDIVVYGDTGFGGVGSLSKSWMTHFLDWWKSYDSSLKYQFLTDTEIESTCDLTDYPNLKLYIQPGGNAYYQQRSLGSSGKVNIVNYLDNGGAYFGACAGFYYAAGDYYWQGDYFDWGDLLGLYPTVEGSITDIADYEGTPDHAITPVSGFNMIYYGGPTRGWRDTSADYPGTKLLSLDAIPGELPAAIHYNNMLLTTVHAEAYENDGVVGLTTEDRIENYKWLANSINDVAGTGFYVPAYTNPPAPKQCDDGLDNDGDGLIDYPADPGCSSTSDDDETDPLPTECNDGVDNDGDGLIDFGVDPGCASWEDDDETDPTGPTELFFDGFEDGSISDWTLSGSGTQWTASTDTAYEGSWAARAKKTGVGDDSFMETTFDASGYGTVTFEYRRKLVGLDGVDDFEVSYFDGTWRSVEHLGSSSANDASFIGKSFTIPSSASKVKFKCECGAVSEKCYVDNVRILGE